MHLITLTICYKIQENVNINESHRELTLEKIDKSENILVNLGFCRNTDYTVLQIGTSKIIHERQSVFLYDLGLLNTNPMSILFHNVTIFVIRIFNFAFIFSIFAKINSNFVNISNALILKVLK